MSTGQPVWQPTHRESLLLRAGLWDPQRAVAAWHEWRRQELDLDSVEQGSQRLLPLVYRNIGAELADEESPDSARLGEIYRASWIGNQLALRSGAQALESLNEAGVPSLVLKGASLIALHYADAGSRPMADVDVAVPQTRTADAVEALGAGGFEPVSPEVARLLEVRHSEAFRSASGHDVDLHVRVLWRPGLEGPAWEEAVPLEIGGQLTSALCPEDQLLHVCAHGAAWNPVSPVRWAADAYKVIENPGGEIDWPRLIALARRARLTLTLSHALAYLHSVLETPVPEWAMADLKSTPVTMTESVAFRALAQPPSPRRAAALAWWLWDRYRAQAEIELRRPSPIGFGRYIQTFWGLPRLIDVPTEGLRRMTVRLRGDAV